MLFEVQNNPFYIETTVGNQVVRRNDVQISITIVEFGEIFSFYGYIKTLGALGGCRAFIERKGACLNFGNYRDITIYRWLQVKRL